MHDQLHHAYFSLQGLNPHCEYMPYTYMFSSKQERFEKRPLSFTWFMSTIFSWNWIKSLKPPIIHSYWIWNQSSYSLTFDRFLLHPLQLHNIKTIMCYGCFMMKEVWWKILLEFRSIGMNRSFATKMWVFVPYIYCRHLALTVLWVFIKGNKSKFTCTEMLPFRRK